MLTTPSSSSPGRRPRALEPSPTRLRLRSGDAVWVRPIGPADGEPLRQAFERLSANSRYQRFHSGTPRLSDTMVAALTHVDHLDREALVALPAPDSQEIVGVARFTRNDREPAAADLAVTVADSWHGRGLGTALLRHLSGLALAAGIDYFTVDMLADNVAVQALVRAVGGVQDGAEGAVVSARIALDDEQPVILCPASGLFRAAAQDQVSTLPRDVHTSLAARPATAMGVLRPPVADLALAGTAEGGHT